MNYTTTFSSLEARKRDVPGSSPKSLVDSQVAVRLAADPRTLLEPA